MLQLKQGLSAGSLAMLAHPGYDVANHGSAIDKAWNSGISTLPYMTQGLSTSDLERLKAEGMVKEYKEMKRSLQPADSNG